MNFRGQPLFEGRRRMLTGAHHPSATAAAAAEIIDPSSLRVEPPLGPRAYLFRSRRPKTCCQGDAKTFPLHRGSALRDGGSWRGRGEKEGALAATGMPGAGIGGGDDNDDDNNNKSGRHGHPGNADESAHEKKK